MMITGRTNEQARRPARGALISPRALCVAAAVTGQLVIAGCTYVPDEANPVEWFKGAREWVGDRKTDEQEKAEAKARTLRMPNQDAPFPKLSSVPDRPDRSAELPAAATATTLEIDRESALSGAAAVRERDSDFVVTPPRRAPVRKAKVRKPAAAPAAKRPPPPPRLPERVRPPPPPVIPDVPGTGDRSDLRTTSPWFVPAVASAETAMRPLPVAERRSTAPRAVPVGIPPSRPTLGPFAGGLEPSPEPRPRPRRRTSAPADIVPAVPTSPTATVRPAAEMPEKLVFGPPPTDIDPFGAAGRRGVEPDRPPARPRGRDRAEAAGQAAAAVLASAQSEPSGASRRIGVVLFSNGSASVGPAGRRVLESAAVAQRKQGGTLRVVGHASSGATGERDPVRHRLANLNMSLDRANAVARELVALGVDPAAVVVGAMSDSEPIAAEGTRGGAARNRRAEIYLDN